MKKASVVSILESVDKDVVFDLPDSMSPSNRMCAIILIENADYDEEKLKLQSTKSIKLNISIKSSSFQKTNFKKRILVNNS